jgi:hypothetical protein
MVFGKPARPHRLDRSKGLPTVNWLVAKVDPPRNPRSRRARHEQETPKGFGLLEPVNAHRGKAGLFDLMIPRWDDERDEIRCRTCPAKSTRADRERRSAGLRRWIS